MMTHKYFTLKSKIILLFLLLGMLPLTVISMILVSFYSGQIKQKTERVLDYAMAQTANNVGHEIQTVSDIMTSVVLNSDMSNLFFQYSLPQNFKDASLRYQLQIRLASYINDEPKINSIIFVRQDLEHVVYFKKYDAAASESFWNEELMRGEIWEAMRYKQFPRRIDGMYAFSSKTFQGSAQLSSPAVFFAFPVHDLVTKTLYGTVIIEVPSSVLNNVISLGEDSLGEGMIPENESYLINEQNIIVSAADPKEIGQPIETLPDYQNRSVAVRSFPVRGTTLTLYSFLDRKALLAEVTQFQWLIVPLLMVIALLFIAVVVAISRRYTDNIRRVAAGLRQFSNADEDVQIQVSPSDEMFIIVEQFNHMKKRIRSLVGVLQQKNIRIQQTTDQRRRAEIRALQAQINPHFLYNTLDSINWKAIANHQAEISRMLNALASLLRYSISNIDIVVPLQAELLWLEKYVYLQGQRFSNDFRLIVELEDEEEALGFPIHKMLLQPLVENSILHGFDKTEQAREQWIQLRARILSGHRLELTLSDNGRGIEPELLERIQRKLESPLIADSQDDDIGLDNIVQRLQLYYGEQSRFSIQSTCGEGTQIVLVIPYVEETWKTGEEV